MRIAPLLLAGLLAAALAACGGDDEGGKDRGNAGSGGGGSGGDGGTGGDGGDGGTGGEAEPVERCPGVRLLELDGAASPAVLTAELDSVDSWVGTCTPPDSYGNDATVRFVAGEAGMYRFGTQGTAFDTVLYALSDCNDGWTELVCDDGPGAGSSLLLLELEAGAEVFVVVDANGVKEPTPFTLTAERIDAGPATIETIETFTNTGLKSGGFRVSGRTDAPVLGFSMQIYDTAGNALLGQPYVASRFEDAVFRVVGNTAADGTFTVEGSFVLNGSTTMAAIEVAIRDGNGQWTEPSRADTRNPRPIATGEACDPAQALSVCPNTDACIDRSGGSNPVCSTATKPGLDAVNAYVNYAAGTWGVVVTGSDPEGDVRTARVTPWDLDGAVLSIGESGSSVVPFHQLGSDGTGAFRGVVALEARFDGKCLPDAQTAYQDCVNAGGNPDDCVVQATALLEACYLEKLTTLAKVGVEVIDAAGKISSKLTVDVFATPEVAAGGVCDPYGAIGACPAGMLCWSEAPMTPETCRDDAPVCPADFDVIELLASPEGGFGAQGTLADGESHGTGSCGGAGPDQVYRLTAPAAGDYTIRTAVSRKSGVDTVLYVRRFCQLAGYELGCNDDASSTTRGSELTVTLAQGEQVFLFVDSAGGAAAGNYTLTVSGP